MFRHRSSRVTADQVQQWEQINPDDIHQMPVETCVLDRRVISGRIVSLPGQDGQYGEETASDDHVERVHAGHCKVQREEQLGMLGINRDFLAIVIEWFIEMESRTGN